MYLIKANVSEAAVGELQDALLKLGVTRLRLAPINGYTSGCEREIVFRGVRRPLLFLPEIEVETIASDEAVDDVVGAIIRISRHVCSDGYVTATPLEQCYRIRSGVREL